MKSNVQFVDLKLWAVLSLAIWFERYGALHIQFYSTTNLIIAHIANGISCIIYLLVTILFIPFYGIYSVPIGLLVGNIGFYSWYAAIFSNKIIRQNRLKFELNTSIISLMIILSFFIFSLNIN